MKGAKEQQRAKKGTRGPPATFTDESCQFSHIRRVLVVGAGVAGLQATRRLLACNFNTLCIERGPSVGGVWSRNFTGFKAQVPWQHYQFPDFPFPKRLQAHGRYPSGQHIQEYVEEYVQHFDLATHIQLHCQLVQLKQHPVTQTWLAVYHNSQQDRFYKIWVEYVVVATGIYNQPFVPECHGAGTFKGVQLHSRDLQDKELLRGKRVVIVGAGKTALDCVAEVATASARSVTMLFRQPHWPVPRKVLGLSTRRLIHSRTLQSFISPYYTEKRRWKHALHNQLRPFKQLLWGALESASTRQFDLGPERMPGIPLQDDLQHTGIVLDNNFDSTLKEAGNVTLLRGELHILSDHGVILKDGSYHEADVILYCTGYQKSYDWLPGELQRKLDMQKDGLYLYRNMIAPHVPNLAFIGCEASTYNNILTSGLQSLWLAHALTGNMPLPDTEMMQADVLQQRRWKREVLPEQRTRGSTVMLYMQSYHDQLMKDMKLKRRRLGLLRELFAVTSPYTATDYTSAFVETESKLSAQHPDNRGLAPQLPNSMSENSSLWADGFRDASYLFGVAESSRDGRPVTEKVHRDQKDSESPSDEASGLPNDSGTSGTNKGSATSSTASDSAS